MKYKQTILVVIVTAVAVWIIINITSNSGNKDKASPVQGSQSTADHHGGSSLADASVFSNLVSKSAPDFTLESYGGKRVSLNNLKGKNVVLFFSEGLMCYPACWNQIAAFGKDGRFNNENTIALTIVNDRKEEWKSAIDKMPELASAIVLFDTNRLVSKNYGVLSLPSSMHKGQLPGHSYVIIDKTGTIRFAKDDIQMTIANDVLISEIGKMN